MMDGFVFGTYYNTNSNFDPKRTAHRLTAKWRSAQTLNIEGDLEIIEVEGQPIRIKNIAEAKEVFIVDLSDRDYELRSFAEFGEQYYIVVNFHAIRIERNHYLGHKALIAHKNIYVESQVDPAQWSNPNQNRFAAPTVREFPLINPPVPFAESRLDLGYDFGASGGASFKTEIITVGDGRETRNSTMALPLHRYQLGSRMIAESRGDLLAEVSYLKKFHAERQGSYEGFRYKDWADYKAVDQLIGFGDGVTTTWQLKKDYFVGYKNISRPITKPVEGTVYLDAPGNLSDWEINYKNGTITCPQPLEFGYLIYASFEFDVPVRFASDELAITLKGYESDSQDAIYQLGAVTLEEIKIPLPQRWWVNQRVQIDDPLDLGIIFESSENYGYATERSSLASGYSLAKANREDGAITFNLGDRMFDRQELDRLLGYFWLARGKANSFRFKNLGQSYQVRFDSDSFNARFEAHQILPRSEARQIQTGLGRLANWHGEFKAVSRKREKTESFFSVSGLKLKTFAADLISFIDPNTYVYLAIDTSGSLNSSIPAINSATAQLKQLLQQRVYGSAERTTQRVLDLNFLHERWVQIFNDNYDYKSVFLIWINEADPVYHETPNYTPTASYLADLENFLAAFELRGKFKAIIYSVNFDTSTFAAWQNHLKAAYLGTDGYPVALKDYDVEIRLDIPETTTAEAYYNDFTGVQILGSEVE